MLFWKVTPHKKQGCFSAGSWWVLVPASHRGCSTSREPSSAAGQLCSTRSANNRQTSRTPTAERLCSPTTETALQLSFCYMFSFLWVPALQGSSPLYGGQPGWNAVMHAKGGIFLIKVLLCVQVDSMSKAKHKSSSGLTGVSILPEGEPISQAHPRSCSNGKEQTNTEPNEAFMNRQAGATQERNHSSVSVSGMFAISSVTWQLRTDASTFATGLTNYN